MPSEVFYTSINESEQIGGVTAKFARLLDASHGLDFIAPKDEIAIKIHFGESGNTRFVKPNLIVPLVHRIKEKSLSTPTITDTNVLYKGRRTFSSEHLKVAHEHGFTNICTGANVAIAEGEDGKDVTNVAVNGKYIKTAKIASLFTRINGLIGVAHFKGHLLTGFGGALKNVGMGCASREGKLAQHADFSPQAQNDLCIGCGICKQGCPVSAISVRNGKASINGEKCIGCAECMALCPESAISIEWGRGKDTIQQRMVEYAKAALMAVSGRQLFVNFIINVSQECDCWTTDYPLIAPDIGIMVSKDPVSIDKASYDKILSRCGKDVFKEAHPGIDGMTQIDYAVALGLGAKEYRLVEVN